MNDRIDFPPRGVPPQKSRMGLYVTLFCFAFLVGGAGAGWVFKDKWWPADEDAQIPLIKAATGPIKVKPDDPGGMKIPNQGIGVYDIVEGGKRPAGVESLLPPPETPIEPPKPPPVQAPVVRAPAPQLPGAAPVPAASPAAPVNSLPLPPPPPEITPPQVAGNSPPPKPLEPEALLLPAAPPVAATPKPAEAQVAAKPVAPPPVSTASAGAGGYRIQLVSVRSEDSANQEWARLKGKNADLLGKLQQSVSRADLGADKGVYYRLRAGPLADEDSAKKLCADLAKRGVGCLVVRPGG